MMKNKKLSVVAALVAAAAVPAIASADQARRSDTRHSQSGWTSIGEVGTHAHDAEDYVPVSTAQRFEQIELTAEGHAVRLADVKFQLADGRIIETSVQRTLRAGESIVLDVPSRMALKMLVLDYANRGPFYRGREDARVEVRGLVTYDRRDTGYDTGYQRDRRTTVRPFVPRPAAVNPGVRIQGGVQIRAGF